MATILYILAALLLLGLMVMVHECGHFFAARLVKIPVKQFSIGFGPKIAQWKSKKYDTEFMVRIIPAGGYCMFYGEDDATGVEKDDPRNLSNHSAWRRMFSIFMGPVMNFVLAFVVCFGYWMIAGEMIGEWGEYKQVSTVDAGGAAEQAGILAGDVILRISGEDAAGTIEVDGQVYDKVRVLLDAYQAGDPALPIVVRRSGLETELLLTPKYSETEKRMMMGIRMSNELLSVTTLPVGPLRAITLSYDYCVDAGGAIIRALKNMVTTGEGINDTAGPVGIVTMIASETQQNGLSAYVNLLILISVNLGLMNLLPIPGLDGSRIIFLLIEAIGKKPVPQKIEAYVHLSGYALLFGLMIFLTFRDVLNIFKG